MRNDKDNGNGSRKDDDGAIDSHPLSFAFPDWLRDKLEEAADAEDKSRSRWMRETTIEKLKRLGFLKDDEPDA